MRNETRFKYNAAMAQLAKLNNVEKVSQKFNVTPSVQQKLEDKIQLSSAFLQKINIFLVQEQSGSAVGLGISRPIASRTNTNNTDRQATDPTSMDERFYFCRQTNFDTAIKYAKLDQWAKFQDFYARFSGQIQKRQGLDRIMIGFNGTSAAATTDRTVNTKLQDVNIGWLQKIRTNAPDRVMSTVTVGAAGTYKNLDALVVDAVNELIDEVHQDDTDLVVICGRSLLADKNFPIVNDASDNTNVLAGQVLLSQKQIGGLPAARVPHFPDNALLITSFDNLSIYYQKDAKRRYIQEKPSKNRIEDYQSSNEAYVIEAYEKVALVEGITIE